MNWSRSTSARYISVVEGSVIMGPTIRPCAQYALPGFGRAIPRRDAPRSALVERQERLRIRRADVIRARTGQAVVGVLLQAVGRPARDAADGEDRREQIDRDPQRVIRRGRVEV